MRVSKQHKKITFHSLLAKSSPYSWRSLFAFIVTAVLSTVLLCFDKLGPANWVELMMWIGGFFITGETAKKFAKKNTEVVEEEKVE
jgi:hypothetical protein